MTKRQLARRGEKLIRLADIVARLAEDASEDFVFVGDQLSSAAEKLLAAGTLYCDRAGKESSK